jgi:nucleoid DNA-binding protein
MLVSYFLQNILKKLKNMGMVNLMNMGKKKMRKRSR